MKKSCGIYEITGRKGRVSYKVFAEDKDLRAYLSKNKDKKCEKMHPVFIVGAYKEYANTEVRKLSSDEVKKYLAERVEIQRRSVGNATGSGGQQEAENR